MIFEYLDVAMSEAQVLQASPLARTSCVAVQHHLSAEVRPNSSFRNAKQSRYPGYRVAQGKTIRHLSSMEYGFAMSRSDLENETMTFCACVKLRLTTNVQFPVYGTIIEVPRMLNSPKVYTFTLGAHAQRWLRSCSFVCLSVCLSVCPVKLIYMVGKYGQASLRRRYSWS